MRISGGEARGRLLPPLKGAGVRPTSARVRAAWFSILGQDLSGTAGLDAFGGSGLMALEAWSRGADVVCYERDRRVAAAIRAAVAGMGATVDVRVADVLEAAPVEVDWVFADPPYALDPGPIVAVLAGRSPVFGLESVVDAQVPTPAGYRSTVHRYGGTALHVFRR